MFKSIRIGNFKAWGEEALPREGIALGRITLLLGTNSSGKTSLLQPFRLMQQTVTAQDPDLQLNLGGEATDRVNLGSWAELIHRHETRRSLHLGFDVETSRHKFQVDVRYGIDSAKKVVVESLGYQRGDRCFRVERQIRGGYLLSAPGYAPPTRPGSSDLDAKRAYCPQRSLMFSPDALAAFGPEAAGSLPDMQWTAYRRFEQLSYLGPLRTSPTRTNAWNQQRPGILGADGSGAVRALLASANTRGDTLVDSVGRWLGRMGFADKLEIRQIGNSTLYEVRLRRGTLDSNLIDVGFGVSQVLPVLTLAYFAPRNSTVIIEEPEIHLHPLAQSLLAELLVEAAAERNLQFLIETHSEHLFRRMQVLIAEERTTHHDVKMYFIEVSDDGTSAVRPLALDRYGRVDNWPDDFFGDAVGETERQMRKMIERLQAGRAGAANA